MECISHKFSDMEIKGLISTTFEQFLKFLLSLSNLSLFRRCSSSLI